MCAMLCVFCMVCVCCVYCVYCVLYVLCVLCCVCFLVVCVLYVLCAVCSSVLHCAGALYFGQNAETWICNIQEEKTDHVLAFAPGKGKERKMNKLK